MLQNHSRGNALVKILLALTVLGALGIYAYTYLQKLEIEKKNSNSELAIQNSFSEIVELLALPENCLASFRTNKPIGDKNIKNLQKDGKPVFPVESVLPGTSVSLDSYNLQSTPKDLKKNKATLTITFKDSRYPTLDPITKTINMYAEIDEQDSVSFCHALSSSIESQNAMAPLRLRLVHVANLGAVAKNSGVRTSIAVATCPPGTLMTSCNGSANGCNSTGESIRKVEPQALNPNTCEVWADATSICDVTARAVAICAKVIQK